MNNECGVILNPTVGAGGPGMKMFAVPGELGLLEKHFTYAPVAALQRPQLVG